MKNRRLMIIAFLLCASIIVGVGYANVTTQLWLNGSAKISREFAENVFDAAVHWESVEVVGGSEKVSASLDNADDTITIVADKLDLVGEEITVKCVLKNNSPTSTATVEIPQRTMQGDGDDYIEITRTDIHKRDGQTEAEISNSGTSSETATFTLEPGDTVEVLITFELIREFIPSDTLVSIESSFHLIYNVTGVPLEDSNP